MLEVELLQQDTYNFLTVRNARFTVPVRIYLMFHFQNLIQHSVCNQFSIFSYPNLNYSGLFYGIVNLLDAFPILTTGQLSQRQLISLQNSSFDTFQQLVKQYWTRLRHFTSSWTETALVFSFGRRQCPLSALLCIFSLEQSLLLVAAQLSK